MRDIIHHLCCADAIEIIVVCRLILILPIFKRHVGKLATLLPLHVIASLPITIADGIADRIISNRCSVDRRQQVVPIAVAVGVGFGYGAIFALRQDIAGGVVGVGINGACCRGCRQVVRGVGVNRFARELVLNIIGIQCQRAACSVRADKLTFIDTNDIPHFVIGILRAGEERAVGISDIVELHLPRGLRDAVRCAEVFVGIGIGQEGVLFYSCEFQL